MKNSGIPGKAEKSDETPMKSRSVEKMNSLILLGTHLSVNIPGYKIQASLSVEIPHLSPNPSKSLNTGKAAEKNDKQGIFLHPCSHPSLFTSSLPLLPALCSFCFLHLKNAVKARNNKPYTSTSVFLVPVCLSHPYLEQASDF